MNEKNKILAAISNTETDKKKFLKVASFYEYNIGVCTNDPIDNLDAIRFDLIEKTQWLNIYGFGHYGCFLQIIKQNKLDEFLFNLLIEEQAYPKLIELDNCLFLKFKTINSYSDLNIDLEQMVFIIYNGAIWSIQEKKGDNFGHIRSRLTENLGVVRKKKYDYLLYLMLEVIIEKYHLTYDEIAKYNQFFFNYSVGDLGLKFIEGIEESRATLLLLKKVVNGMKNALSQFYKIDEQTWQNFNLKYILELKEQAHAIVENIDLDLHRLEGVTTLYFSIQNQKLNQVMKTLTIYSAIFIPLTFLAGIYGMNFHNMPELVSANGYFIVLTAMLSIAAVTIFYFKHKKWF